MTSDNAFVGIHREGKKEAQLLARSACLLGDVSCCEDERCPKYAEHLASGLFPAGDATACRGGSVAHSTRKRTTIISVAEFASGQHEP